MNAFDEGVDCHESASNWHGVSLQLETIRNEKLLAAPEEIVNQAIDILDRMFRHLIALLDDGNLWIVNHDDKDMQWFLDQSETLPRLREVFRHTKTPGTYRGSILMFDEDLLELSRELVTYAYALSYKNLDVSHGTRPVVIKATGHLTLDILSTDFELMSHMLADSSLDVFTKVPYRIR